jgi:hypothetical protein
MRRVIFLALLAFALPGAALADDIQFNSGTFEYGTITSSFGNNFRVQVVGSSDSITLNIPNVSCVAKGTECYFAGGTVTVVNPAGVTVFTDGLEPGYMKVENGTEAYIFGYLQPDSFGIGGSTEFNINFEGDKLLSGDAGVLATPEPGALEGLLLGTGLLGLAEMMGRKFQLGT